MYLTKKLMVVAFALIILTVSACSTKNDENNSRNEINSEFDNNLESENMDSEKNESSFIDGNKEQQPIDKEVKENIPPVVSEDDKELEEALAAYRKERETMVAVKMGNGLKGYGAPNQEDYGIDDNGTKYLLEFDSRETAKAYETAENYIKETLGIEPETKVATYMCIDPRMYSIYEDEDKGVAEGYENDNIFITEYYDGEVWQYLILVRDSKEDPWKVIHHGSSYKE